MKIINITKAPKEILKRHEERVADKKKAFTPDLDKKTIALLLKNFFFYTEYLGFNKKDEMLLLGNEGMDYKTLTKMKEKGSSKIFTWDTYHRVANFLGIIKSLKIIYPRNEELVKHWIDVERDVFSNKSAKSFLIEKPIDSYKRIESVRRILDLYRNGTINDLT